MKKNLLLHIAFSLLMARWKQTLVAAIGVTFSITMFITLLSFMSGLNDLLDGLILNRSAHVHLFKEISASKIQALDLAQPQAHHFIRHVKPKQDRIELYNHSAIVQSLNKDSMVLGIAPRVTAQVFFNVGPIDITGAINGVDPVEENRLYFFKDYVTQGNYLDLINVPNSIILGKAAADKMLAHVGDVVQVSNARGELFPLKVVGFFQSGIQDLDKVQSYASIKTTQKLLGKGSEYITDLNVKLKNMENAPAMAKRYRAIYHLEAEDIQTANSQFETGSSIRSLISYAVGITLLIVAGFGIYNILNMMIYEKMDSIAILKAVGFSGKDVQRIFLSIALSIGVFGGSLGLLFGLGLSGLIDQIPFNTAALPTITTYPINYNPKFYLIGAVFSVITTYFAGFFPSKKASNIDPVVIIRGK